MHGSHDNIIPRSVEMSFSNSRPNCDAVLYSHQKSHEAVTAKAEHRHAPRREDVRAFAVGIAVSFFMTFLIYLLSYRLESVPHFPDRGYLWYYWILKEPTFWTRFSVWGLYFCHQFAHWACIYYGQNHITTTTTTLQPIHYISLVVNLLFSVLHVIQTHVTYDGTAQDMSILSSQGSVIVLLIWVLLMENNTRGLVFGYPAPISKELIHFARKYHGYYFSWAVIYTFWYHPAEATQGHLWGFLYTFLLLLQGSLFLTRIHLNRWWKLTLEVLVLFHGVIVAYVTQGLEMWTMFLTGFLAMFVITQMHGLRLSFAAKLVLAVSIVIPCVVIYCNKELYRLNEPIRIPFINYLGVFVLAGILYVVRIVKMAF